MIASQVALLPRDGVFVKDGRGWYTSDIGRSHAHPWPLPPTVRGALRAAFGHALMAKTGRSLSPNDWERESEGVAITHFVTLRRRLGERFAPEHRMWPVPADALYLPSSDTITRLEPMRPRLETLGRGDDPATERLYRPYPAGSGKPERAPMFWRDEDMMRWLRGEDVAKQDHAADKLSPVRRTDVHVTIAPDTQTAEPSMMFSSEVAEPLTKDGCEWAIGLGCSLPEGAEDMWRAPILLGGRRRLANAEILDPGVFAPPPRVSEPWRGLRLVLVTPAEFERGFLPDGFSAEGSESDAVYAGELPGVDGSVLLRAALVPRPLHVSTWDTVRRAPRATRSLVRPGAVYFFEKKDKQSFSPDDVASLWLKAIGRGQQDGLGLVVPGLWNPPS